SGWPCSSSSCARLPHRSAETPRPEPPSRFRGATLAERVARGGAPDRGGTGREAAAGPRRRGTVDPARRARVLRDGEELRGGRALSLPHAAVADLQPLPGPDLACLAGELDEDHVRDREVDKRRCDDVGGCPVLPV